MLSAASYSLSAGIFKAGSLTILSCFPCFFYRTSNYIGFSAGHALHSIRFHKNFIHYLEKLWKIFSQNAILRMY